MSKRQNPLSLDKSEFQLFMKRLRKRLAPRQIKYFHCGEYGSESLRPHYHACIFGHDFPDRELWSVRDNIRLYRSKILESLWPYGFCTIGDVTFDSAAYVARYIMKKITGDLALTHYAVIDPDTGEILYDREPEYTTMSNGIGKKWFEKYASDVYPSDEIIINGKRMKAPKYYDKLLALDDNYDLDLIKQIRMQKAQENYLNNTPERLDVREFCLNQKLKQLPRN